MDNILFYFAALNLEFFLTPLIDQYWPPLSIFFSFPLLHLSVCFTLSLSSNHAQLKSRKRGERIESLELSWEQLFAIAVCSSQDCFRDVSIVVCTTLSVTQHHCLFIYLLINELPPFVDLFSDLFLSQYIPCILNMVFSSVIVWSCLQSWVHVQFSGLEWDQGLLLKKSHKYKCNAKVHGLHTDNIRLKKISPELL